MKGLAQGRYVAARVVFKPATLQTQGTEPTIESPRPASISYYQAMSCKVVSLLSYCHLFSLQPMHPFIPEAHVSELILIEVCKGIEAISVQNPFALRLFCHLVCSWMTNYGFVL